MGKEARIRRQTQADAVLFEKLVAQLERLLSPDLEILWNDRIPDKTTGTGRQIDVVSRRNGIPVAMIECRRQGRVQEVKWIHEVIGRKKRVACPKAVLVSSRGFSREAYEVAKDEGIELRTFRELSAPGKIAEFFPGFRFEKGHRSLAIARTEFHFLVETTAEKVKREADCQELIRDELRFSTVDSSGPSFDFNALAAQLGLQRNHFWTTVIDGAPPLVRDLVFFFTDQPIDDPLFHCQRILNLEPFEVIPFERHLSDGRLWVEARGRRFRLGALRMEVTQSQELLWSGPPDQVTVYESADQDLLAKSAYLRFSQGDQPALLCFHVVRKS